MTTLKRNTSNPDKEWTDALNEKGDAAIGLDYSESDSERTFNGILSPEDADFYHGFSESARDKAYRKVDIRLVPMLALLYLFSCKLLFPPLAEVAGARGIELSSTAPSVMDRANIGNAKIEGMNADIGLTGVQYNIVSSIFFVTYVIFEIPANSILQRDFSGRPSLWIGIITISWGVCMTFHGVVQNFAGLLSARLVLGVTEAGFYPGALLICARWYPRFRLQKRVALFYTSSAFAGALSGLLAFVSAICDGPATSCLNLSQALAKMDGLGGYEGWRWIFLIECVLRAYAFFQQD